MKEQEVIDLLEEHIEVFAALLTGPMPEFIEWRPAPEKWNLREIVAHLYDEEREDFRARVLHFIYKPHEPLKPIDPEGWVKSRSYHEMDYHLCLADFLTERKESISILREISLEIWAQEFQHSKLGSVGARFFLRNWLAHDLLHIKQIVRQKHLFLASGSDILLDYAG